MKCVLVFSIHSDFGFKMLFNGNALIFYFDSLRNQTKLKLCATSLWLYIVQIINILLNNLNVIKSFTFSARAF